MTFEEIFHPSIGTMRDQQNLDKVRLATEIVGEAPPASDRLALVDIPELDTIEPFEPPHRGEKPQGA